MCYTLTVVLHGWFNGISRAVVPLICTVLSLGVVRLPLSYSPAHAWGVDGIMWATAIGWVVGLGYTLLATWHAVTVRGRGAEGSPMAKLDGRSVG